SRRVAKGVPGCLTVGMTGCLQFLADRPEFVPGFREFLGSGLRQPRSTIGDEPAAYGPGNADPFAANRGEGPLRIVVAALRFADLFGHVGDIDDTVRV